MKTLILSCLTGALLALPSTAWAQARSAATSPAPRQEAPKAATRQAVPQRAARGPSKAQTSPRATSAPSRRASPQAAENTRGAAPSARSAARRANSAPAIQWGQAKGPKAQQRVRDSITKSQKLKSQAGRRAWRPKAGAAGVPQTGRRDAPAAKRASPWSKAGKAPSRAQGTQRQRAPKSAVKPQPSRSGSSPRPSGGAPRGV